jgi:hypothetical protein
MCCLWQQNWATEWSLRLFCGQNYTEFASISARVYKERGVGFPNVNWQFILAFLDVKCQEHTANVNVKCQEHTVNVNVKCQEHTANVNVKCQEHTANVNVKCEEHTTNVNEKQNRMHFALYIKYPSS